MRYRHYRQHEILALPDLGPIAVHLFIDMHGVDRYQMGEWVERSGRVHPVRSDEPVAVTVTRAFAEGLSARGYAVVDRRGSPFEPGQAESGARVAVSSEIEQPWGIQSSEIPEGDTLLGAAASPTTGRPDALTLGRRRSIASPGWPGWQRSGCFTGSAATERQR